jgi:hypothetical protein
VFDSADVTAKRAVLRTKLASRGPTPSLACVLRSTLGTFLLVWLAGCATAVSVTPNISTYGAPNCVIHAVVRYDGKPEYLPQALSPIPNESATTFLKYSYEASYGINETNPALTMFNPLTLVGFPTSSDYLVVIGHIDVIQGTTTLRSYAAASSMKRSETIFSEGETFTSMRRRGLLLVAENLSAQVCTDQGSLRTLMSDSPSQDVNQTH